MMKKDESTPESRRFWRAAEAAAREVASWPAWKRLEDPRIQKEDSQTMSSMKELAFEAFAKFVVARLLKARLIHPADEDTAVNVILTSLGGGDPAGDERAAVLEYLKSQGHLQLAECIRQENHLTWRR